MGRGERRGARSAAVAWVWTLALAVACGGAEPEETLDREQFVEVVTELRRAGTELSGRDSAAARYAERKREILSRHGVEEEELRQYLRSHQEDLGRIHEVWDTLGERLREAPPADSATERE